MAAHGGQPQGDSPYCSFHPRELLVGVCAHCLKDRLLLLLAASSAAAAATKDADALSRFRPAALRRRTSSLSLPKVFALGSSFLQRLDSRHHHHHAGSDDGTASSVATSLDDSFISIKLEDNGKATGDEQQQQQQQQQQQAAASTGGNNPAAAAAAAPAAPVRSSSTAVVEHVKRGGVTRWRKQVLGRLLQLARWRRSAAAVGVDGKKAAAERSKARGRGWIRSLTRRRTASGHGRDPSAS